MSGPKNVEAGLSCPQCANPRDIYRYCMNCGFDFADLAESEAPFDSSHYAATDEADTAEPAAVPPSHVLPPPTTEPTPPIVGGASAPVMLGIAFAAICVLLIIGAAMISVLGNDEDKPSQTVSENPNSASSNGSTPNDPTPAPDGARCWDGSAAATVSDCTAPTGTVGLAWVFPSFQESQCTNKSASGAKPAKWRCRVTAPGGGQVTIRYREHGSVAKAQATYTRDLGRANRRSVLSAREDVERYVWRAASSDNNGLWVVSSLYAEHPWSVTIKGRQRASVDRAFAEVVEFRNPRRMTGQPS